MSQQVDEPGEPAAANHQHNLINALSKLQHRGLEKILGGQESAVTEEPTETYFSFPIGPYHFVVNAGCFCEVFVDVAVAALPNSPYCLRGLCNLRGLLLPVYQLHGFLGQLPAKKPAIFCIGKGEKAVGLLIDALPTSMSFRRSGQKAEPTANKLLDEISSAQFFSAGKAWHLLDGNRIGEQLFLLAATEQQYFPKAQVQEDSLLG